MKTISPEIREALRKPLPKEAISKHPTKTFLSSIKAIYVEERLNDVFGIGSWKTKVEHIVTEKAQKADKNGLFPLMVVCKLTFEVPEYGIYHECYGGNDNADLGDAYKGATTDAITKVGSYLEIGIDVFKGLADKPDTKQNPEPTKYQKACLLIRKQSPNIKTLAEYKEACMTLTGFELLPANYDTIINLLTK